MYSSDGSTVVKRVKDYACQYAATKSLPFSASEMAMDVVAAAFSTVAPEEPKVKAIRLLHAKGYNAEANMLANLRHVSARVDVGGAVPSHMLHKKDKNRRKRKLTQKKLRLLCKRSRFRHHRTNAAKRMMKIATDVVKVKAEFLMCCPYVGIIVDEGNNYKRSCPLYVGVICCDNEFRWRIMFVGQEDTEGRKTGEAIHELVKKVFQDNGLENVYKKIVAAGTDGASVMRSSSVFDGLDCRGMTGASFSAHLKRDLKEDLDFWHCLCHKLNLSINDALDAIPALKLYYIPHLRMCHSEFKRSSKARAGLKEILKTIVDQMQDFNKSHDWKVFYPILFCLTRWLGLQTCAAVMAKKNNRHLIQLYAQMLRDHNMGARAFDPFKYRRQRRMRAGDDDLDGEPNDEDGDSSGSDDEDEERELRDVARAIEEGRIDDDGYQPQPQLFKSADEAARSAPSQSDMEDADDFDEGNDNAARHKRKNLLNKSVGLTDLNLGRSAYMAGALKPYKILVEQLQRTDQPVQHKAARQIRQFYMVMKASYIGTPESEPMFACREFQEWCAEMETKGKEELVALVKTECRAFCSVMITSVKE